MAPSWRIPCCISIASLDEGDVRNSRARKGSALLDVVLALVILGLSGVALVTLLGQTAHSARNVRNTERVVRRASDELDRFVIHDRAQLIAMLGRSSPHGWLIDVPGQTLDVVDVATAAGDAAAPVL